MLSKLQDSQDSHGQSLVSIALTRLMPAHGVLDSARTAIRAVPDYARPTLELTSSKVYTLPYDTICYVPFTSND